ncbi:glycosyltransferase [Mesobacillus maritimus]|uniref:glycosyltransferase n=1 Tax=Mesobacillus maritimus TaxID=1643336 RepID=UPI00203B9458|nr:glycosyltransferase [Mesobacillus maritimus]MCM3670899.1 glycosyltransferase [Mesobacillus maritimus]
MKILFVVNCISGGASNVIQMLAIHYQQKGYQVDLLLYDGVDAPSRYDLSQINIIELPKLMPVHTFNSIARVFHQVKNVNAYLKMERPDLIISFLDNISTLTCLAAWKMDIPIIVSERNNTLALKPKFPWNQLRKIAYKRANMIVVQCSIFAEFYNGFFKGKTQVIPNPVLKPRIKQVANKNQGINLVSAGRLVDQKNFEWLINAFAEIYKHVPEAKLTIYGRGEKEKELQNLIKRLKLNSSVTLAGYTTNVHEKLAQADIYVMTSVQEGFPNSLCEAMAVGLPVVALKCHDGLKDIIDDSQNGFLIEMNNQEAFIDKVIELAKENNLRKNIGFQAQKVSERYSQENIFSLWDEAIQKVLEKRCKI